MASQKEITNDAIRKRIDDLRARIAAERQAEEKEDVLLQEAAQWDKVPDDISDEMITALVVRLQSEPFASAAFRKGFVEDFNRFISELKANDFQRLMRTVGPAVEVLNNPRIAPAFPRIELITVAPEDEGGEWILIAAPLQVDDGYEVSMPEVSPCGESILLIN